MTRSAKALLFALLFSVLSFAQQAGYTVPTSGVGLGVIIGPGTTTLNNGTIVTWLGGTINLTARSTNYGYIDPTTGNILVSTSGFAAGSIPLFTSTTDSFGVLRVVDSRTSFGLYGSGSTINLASPGPIGGTTPGTGAFTYLTNSGTVTGITYYVDNCVVTGNDSNNGTAAATPFLTIAKANTLSLNPGDRVLFRRGCTWREQLQTPSSGTALGSITYSSYGQGTLPVITGFVVTTGFSVVAGNVYNKTGVTTQPFVVSFNGNLLFYNHVGTSITANQWDWAANVLYINVGANPSTGTVELDSANDAIFVNKQFITIDSLAVTGGNVYGVEFGSGAGNDTIQNCDIYNTFWGIITNTGSGNNVVIQDNQIHSTVENGMSLQNSGATGTIVQRNNVYGIGGRGGRSTNTQGIFLGSLGTGTVVQFNNLHDGGDDDSDHGVYMSATSGVSGAPDVIRYNHIYNYAGWGIKVANSNWVDATYNLIHGTEGGMIVEQGSGSHINFYNNTIANTVAGGGGSGLRASVGSFISFKNNILYNVNDMVDGSKFNIFLDPSVTNFTSDYNEVWSATPNVSGFYAFASSAGQTWAAWQGLGFDTHGLNVDPLLVNPANNDFRPSVGSSVNGAGINLGAPFNRSLRIDPIFSADVSAIPNVPSLGADQQAFNLGGLGWDMGALVSDAPVPKPLNGTAPLIGSFKVSQLTTPVTPVATCSGACAGGTWSYKIVAFDWLNNATAASAAASATNAVTLTSVNYNTVTFNPQPGVWYYGVYRTVSAGTPSQLSLVCTFYNNPPYVSTQFQFHSTSSFGSNYGCRDDGSVTTSTATPSTTNATGNVNGAAFQCGITGTLSCVITGSGSSSGTATLTFPATAGTATNAILSSNSFSVPIGDATHCAYCGTGSNGGGLYWQNGDAVLDSSNGWGVQVQTGGAVRMGQPGSFFNAGINLASNGITTFQMGNAGGFSVAAGSSAGGAAQATLSSPAAGLWSFDSTTIANQAAFTKSANTVSLSADWTCGTGGTVSSCVAATIIGSTATPLTFTLPLIAKNWSFECELVVGQATAATSNQWNLLTATNGVTSTTASYTMATAATAFAAGAVTDQASTTTTFQIAPSWTLGGTGTKMPVHIAGTLTGASASGTVFSLQLVAPTVGDLVTIYEGSKCSQNP